jgi:thymidine kinase
MGPLRLTCGTMDCGKSAQAVQVTYNLARVGRRGLAFTLNDRNGATVSSRLGISAPAIVVDEVTDFASEAARAGADHLICDEQFYPASHIDVFAELADRNIDVHCFGILTDFSGRLFPACQRLPELADVADELELRTYCWCGAPGRMNARVVAGQVVYAGPQVAIGDTGSSAERVSYAVPCRAHWRSGQLRPSG